MIKTVFQHSLIALCSLSLLSGCHSISKSASQVSERVLGLFGQEKTPELDPASMLDAAKAAQEQFEKLLASRPLNQWVYLENPQLGTASLQNKAADQHILTLSLNCKMAEQRPSFSLSSPNGQTLLKAYDDSAGQVQFLLDNKNFGNPFNLHSSQKLESFKTALASAKTLKIFHASKLYTFQNQHAELLEQPVSCQTP